MRRGVVLGQKRGSPEGSEEGREGEPGLELGEFVIQLVAHLYDARPSRTSSCVREPSDLCHAVKNWFENGLKGTPLPARDVVANIPPVRRQMPFADQSRPLGAPVPCSHTPMEGKDDKYRDPGHRPQRS